nr:hypothetical protein BaRGS_033235 [Batillaria attramentaria]
MPLYSLEFASRTCQPDGTWVKHPTQENSNKTWTNFTACVVPTPELPDISHHAVHGDRLTLMYTVGYSVSLAALVIAVFIMLCCRRLQSKSNTLHINLFLAFILRAVLASLKDHLFVGGLGLPKDVTFKNVDGRIIMDFIQEGEGDFSKRFHWECRLITVLFFFTISATQTWILMEGLKFAKFILVLIPLFGIMYIVLNITFPAGDTEKEYNVVYLYIEMGYNSFQASSTFIRWHFTFIFTHD